MVKTPSCLRRAASPEERHSAEHGPCSDRACQGQQSREGPPRACRVGREGRPWEGRRHTPNRRAPRARTEELVRNSWCGRGPVRQGHRTERGPRWVWGLGAVHLVTHLGVAIRSDCRPGHGWRSMPRALSPPGTLVFPSQQGGSFRQRRCHLR